MPAPRTIGIGLSAACADHEKIECRFVSATISSAVIGAPISVVVMALLYRTAVKLSRSDGTSPLPVEHRRADRLGADDRGVFPGPRAVRSPRRAAPVDPGLD